MRRRFMMQQGEEKLEGSPYRFKGKFLDSAAEDRWYWYVNKTEGNTPGDAARAIPVDPDTKEFDFLFKEPLTSCYQIFIHNNYTNDIQRIDYFPDTSNVTDMSYMFDRCYMIQNLDLRGWNTSNVTNMRYMFSMCQSLRSVNMSGLDLSNVTDFESMFNGCDALEEIDMSGVVFGADIRSMFCNLETGAPTVNFSNADTSRITSMYALFCDCSVGDVIGLDTSAVIDMSYMFDCNYGSESRDLSGFDTSNVQSMELMFGWYSVIRSLNISNFDFRNVINAKRMFASCEALESIDMSNVIWWDESVDGLRAIEMFADCDALIHIRCPQAVKDWCIANQDDIMLPEAMREGGSGTWEIVD